MTVYLRSDWHNMSNYGVHFNREFDLQLKRAAQREFEKTHSRMEFMRIFGKNYIWEDEMEEQRRGCNEDDFQLTEPVYLPY